VPFMGADYGTVLNAKSCFWRPEGAVLVHSGGVRWKKMVKE
jgi:hypothetical protein